MNEPRIIICDSSVPTVDKGLIFIPYGELVSGYRHAYRVTTSTGRTVVKHSRRADHPADEACPECARRLEE